MFVGVEGGLSVLLAPHNMQLFLRHLSTHKLGMLGNLSLVPLLSHHQVGGEAKGEIMSPALCTAFFSVFLDKEAVVAREKLVERAPLFF